MSLLPAHEQGPVLTLSYSFSPDPTTSLIASYHPTALLQVRVSWAYPKGLGLGRGISKVLMTRRLRAGPQGGPEHCFLAYRLSQNTEQSSLCYTGIIYSMHYIILLNSLSRNPISHPSNPNSHKTDLHSFHTSRSVAPDKLLNLPGP